MIVILLVTIIFTVIMNDTPCPQFHIDPYMRDLQCFADRLSHVLGIDDDKHDFGAKAPLSWKALEKTFSSEDAAMDYAKWIRASNPFVVPILHERTSGTHNLILAAGHYEYGIFSSEVTPSLETICNQILQHRGRFHTRSNVIESMELPLSLKGKGFGENLLTLWHRELERNGFEMSGVVATEKTKGFWERFGYYKTGGVWPEWSLEGGFEKKDDIILRKYLGPCNRLPVTFDVEPMQAFKFKLGNKSRLIQAQWGESGAAIFLSGAPLLFTVSSTCKTPQEAIHAFFKDDFRRGVKVPIEEVPISLDSLPSLNALEVRLQHLVDTLGNVTGKLGNPRSPRLSEEWLEALEGIEQSFRTEMSAHIHARWLSSVYPDVHWIVDTNHDGSSVKGCLGYFDLSLLDRSHAIYPSLTTNVKNIVNLVFANDEDRCSGTHRLYLQTTKDGNCITYINLPLDAKDKGLEKAIVSTWEFERQCLGVTVAEVLVANKESHAFWLGLGYHQVDSFTTRHNFSDGPWEGDSISGVLMRKTFLPKNKLDDLSLTELVKPSVKLKF